MWQKRLEPEEILTQVVDQYEKLVVSMRDVLAQSEIAEKKILQNIATSEKNVTALEAETKELTDGRGRVGCPRGALQAQPRTAGRCSAFANSWISSVAKLRSHEKDCLWWSCNCGSTKSGGASC